MFGVADAHGMNYDFNKRRGRLHQTPLNGSDNENSKPIRVAICLNLIDILVRNWIWRGVARLVFAAVILGSGSAILNT